MYGSTVSDSLGEIMKGFLFFKMLSRAISINEIISCLCLSAIVSGIIAFKESVTDKYERKDLILRFNFNIAIFFIIFSFVVAF